MYCFTDGPLAAYERLMKIPPSKKSRYNDRNACHNAAADYNCSACKYRMNQKRGCYQEQCPFYAERIYYGYVRYAEALLRMVTSLGVTELMNRVRYLNKDTEKTEMFFSSMDHKSRFAKLKKQEILHSGSSPAFTAVLYLLTASSYLWHEIKPAVYGGRIDFKSFELGKLANGDWQNYTLYKMAKEIYTGKTEIAFTELCDKKIVGDKSFRLIINAFLICRYGLKVVRV